ncbi:hypothetical protein Hanom_Chr06g00529701 [Helianthus anomalus]
MTDWYQNKCRKIVVTSWYKTLKHKRPKDTKRLSTSNLSQYHLSKEKRHRFITRLFIGSSLRFIIISIGFVIKSILFIYKFFIRSPFRFFIISYLRFIIIFIIIFIITFIIMSIRFIVKSILFIYKWATFKKIIGEFYTFNLL